MAAALTSDHVNYLIWRYLQEQGYGKAAIQLSRDWQTSDPQSLPFTASVQPSYLVSILQDGLAYDQLLVAARQTQDRSTSATGNDGEGHIQGPGPQGKRYTFVDVKKRRASQRSDDGAVNQESDAPRKRPRLDQRIGPTQQTPARRKSSKNVGLSVQTQSTPTQLETAKPVDNEVVLRAQEVVEEPEEMEESPVPEEPPPLVPTLEIGASTGMQSEEIIDETLVKTTATHVIPNADIYTVLRENEDPSKLTVIGGSTWHSLTLELPPSSDDQVQVQSDEPNIESNIIPSPVQAQSLNIRSSSQFLTGGSTIVPKYAVSHFAYAPGSAITARVVEELWGEDDSTGVIALDTKDETLELARPISCVLSLRFDPASRYLLAAWHADDDDEETSILRVWDITRPDDEAPKVLAKGIIRDSTWLTGESFVVCGEGWLQFFDVKTEGEGDDHELTILPTERLTSSHGWEQVVYDSIANKLACMSGSDGALGMVDVAANELKTKVNAHKGMVTAIQWQPRAKSVQEGPSIAAPATDTPHQDPMDTDQPEPKIETKSESSLSTALSKSLLATSSADGTVKLWNAAEADLECLLEWSMEPKGMPAWTMAFSPNGNFIAAAGDNLVLVWRVDEEGKLVTRWPVATEEGSNTKAPDTSNETLFPTQSKKDVVADRDGDEEMTDDPPIASSTTIKDTDVLAQAADDDDANVTTTAIEPSKTPKSVKKKDEEDMLDIGSAALAPLHSLIWSADGKRLVYALGNQISVLDFEVSQ